MKIEERRIRTTSSESRVEETSLLLVTHEPDQCIECQHLARIVRQHLQWFSEEDYVICN